MKLVLLGTTGYHPNDRRQTACLMLPEIGVLLDAGTAIYRARPLIETETLDIFLTHAHLDHCIGLTFLFDVLHEKNVERVNVHGEQAKLEAIREHLFSELLFPVLPPIDMQPIAESVELPHGGKLTHFPLEHPGGSIGYRLDWPDRSMAYVTDTVAKTDADYLEKIAGVDLLIHECNFDDGMEEHAQLTGHSCLTPVVEVAKKAEIGRMVLVHINPLFDDDSVLDLEAARKIFPNVEIGTDGMVLDF
ncbi:MAG: MBL fold metallo-hydrolase [Lacipirellulaceae bacterium]